MRKGYPNNVKGWKRKFFFILEIIGNSFRDISGGRSFAGPEVVKYPSYNKLPILIDLKEQRFNKVLKKIWSGGFFPVTIVLGPKAFRKCFALGSKKMASGGGDNAEDKHVEGAAQVASDEGESHQSRDEHPRAMSRKIDMQKLACLAKGSKAATLSAKGMVINDSKGKGTMPQLKAKKKAAKSSKVVSKGATPVVAPEEGTSVNPSDVLGLNASMLENPERLEKEIDEHKAREVLARKSAVEEYKTLDDFQEIVEQAASRYYGEGFDLCKKQIGHFHPELDIEDMEIDDELP
ncbi:hypothetical protein Acr_29g0001070 [Actinidia rufa]|uniref:Uncharacterized protein n=1 Tax=Actinidia rufa TaxID=165716 RepID=A0A7J0HD93_9ERIC|nr:hypothetical protein Acr_29g0001070 [Actinidia rufa]